MLMNSTIIQINQYIQSKDRLQVHHTKIFGNPLNTNLSIYINMIEKKNDYEGSLGRHKKHRKFDYTT